MAKKIPAGEFKAQCLMLMDRVKKYGQAVTITKHGKPVARLVPAQDEVLEKVQSPFGVMAGTAEIKGDIVKSTGEKWSADEK
ncbi:type II toxin-antitoxin system Phd/YefM family antitoxin [Bdellovibrio sp. HCB-110]|uniref:type II toxin-antitoxin system Phd/YefM family antitoxin n=1 Tax=Bdellovibrio sp. HCB-110 TaxID=3391182 RepID=UPI0039B612E3